MPEHRSTQARRNASAGLVSVRVGPRVYWVPTEVGRKVEAICAEQNKAETEGETVTPAAIAPDADG